jgi:hypothetical protein
MRRLKCQRLDCENAAGTAGPPLKAVKKKVYKVVFASELRACPDCGEPWCRRHQEHYADCKCVGPTEEGYEYFERNGVLYARKLGDDEG